MKYDVAVIGAGVIGGMVARELSKYKLSVCILEKENDVSCGASKANSGIVHGGFDPEPDTLKAKLNVSGVEKLFSVAKMLNVPIIRNGSFVCAFGKDEEEHIEQLYQRGIKNGVSGMEIISGEKARELEPQLSKDVSLVLNVTTSGIVCPYELTIAAVGNAMDNGVDLIRNFETVSIEKNDGAYIISSSTDKKIEAEYVVNCAGCKSDSIARMIGDYSFEIITRAGEYLLLDKAEGQRVSRTIFQVPSKEGKGILVSPTVDGNLLVGPTATVVEDDTRTQTTANGLQNVKALSGKSVPTINYRNVITSFTGIRSSEAGGDFIIGESNVASKFINVAAIDSPGLSSCVSIAEYTVDVLKNAGLKLEENADFNGCREDGHKFRKMNDQEKNEYIKHHPSYGKIVCRCESISEGEIVDAIKRNPKPFDIDGVKRRTRSGMGRCQGGFCGPEVMKLIAYHNGFDKSEITKFGKGSKMLFGKL